MVVLLSRIEQEGGQKNLIPSRVVVDVSRRERRAAHGRRVRRVRRERRAAQRDVYIKMRRYIDEENQGLRGEDVDAEVNFYLIYISGMILFHLHPSLLIFSFSYLSIFLTSLTHFQHLSCIIPHHDHHAGHTYNIFVDDGQMQNTTTISCLFVQGAERCILPLIFYLKYIIHNYIQHHTTCVAEEQKGEETRMKEKNERISRL